MKHRKDEPGFYCDSELRKMRSDDIPEMYIALRKIGVELPAEEILRPILITKAFREQVVATIRRFYTREQIEKWEAILRGREEGTKEIVYKARKMPFPIRWFGNGWRALKKITRR